MAETGATIKNMLLAGFGVFTQTKESIEQIVNDLVTKGNVKENDASDLVKQIFERAETERRTLTELVHEQVGTIVRDMGAVTKADLERISERIEKIEELIG
jgi:polyhydroxyalkanoate synthesis regulator phasin